jgi:hypothetical protein
MTMTLATLLGDALRSAIDADPRVRLHPLDERRLIAEVVEHVEVAGYTLTRSTENAAG